jgi:hypothetical protein
MISLPRLLLPLPRKPQFLLLPHLLCSAITVAEFLESVFTLLVQVGILLNLGLVEPVHGRVQAGGDIYALDLCGGLVSKLDTLFFHNLSESKNVKEILRRRQNYLFGVLEAYLANSHTTVLLQVGPWRVDDCDVVFLIA